MNIFFLLKLNDTNYKDWAKQCAELHLDKHVVKMIIEYAQLLSTAHRVLDGKEYIDDSGKRKVKRWKLYNELDTTLYKATHPKHPSTLWCRKTSENYKLLYNLFIYLCDEYTYRYKKIHLTDKKLRNVLSQLPKNIKEDNITPFPQAMPDKYKCECSVQAYHNYYNGDKQHIAKWTKRTIPNWYKIK